jgi:DNA ligase (NAD+)
MSAYFTLPTHCPACSTPLVREGEYIVCRGEDCPAQVVGGISRWVKKIGVLGIGDAVIEALVDAGKISDASDLYLMNPKDIESVTVGGSRLGSSAHTIVTELKSKVEMPLHVLVGSTGIPMCSRSVCKLIVEAGYDTLDKMKAARPSQIADISGMGPVKAQAFYAGLRTRLPLIERLLANGVRLKVQAVGSMTGLSVCMTGFRDAAMEQAIEAQGGTVKSSVGKGLSYLVAKDPNGASGKLDKARGMGVYVLSPADMWHILNKTP